MQNSEPLIWLGFGIIAALAIAICVPYLRGKSDALTAWNIMLLGGILFTGVGSLAVVWGDFHWPELQWFQPTKEEVRQYVIGSVVFYATLLIAYYLLPFPKWISKHFLNQWPPASFSLLVGMLALFGGVMVAAALSRGIFFVGPALLNISHKAMVFAVVFSFCYWFQNKRQLPLLFLFLAVFVMAALNSMVVFLGRRLLLSIAIAPLICMYWLSWRYKSPHRNLLRLGIAASLALSVAAFYSTFRHFSNVAGAEQRSLQSTIAAMKNASAKKAVAAVTDNAFFYFGQYCAHYSLLTIHLVDSGELESKPLDSLLFLVGYPVPRAIWTSKPQPLGITIVRDVLRLPYKTNWGLGIVANGYREGGIPTIMLYAVLLVVGVRLLDDALQRQPNNVFLLGILCTSAPHWVTMIRGEPCVMAAEIGEAFVFAWALGLGARFFYGTAPVALPITDARKYHPHALGLARPLGG